MQPPLKIGFLGAGGIAGHHLKQLQEMPEVEITAVCDTVLERARSRVQEFGGRAYTEFRQMLDDIAEVATERENPVEPVVIKGVMMKN